jgi:hypothetical protein
LGQLKARLAKLRTELQTPTTKVREGGWAGVRTGMPFYRKRIDRGSACRGVRTSISTSQQEGMAKVLHNSSSARRVSESCIAYQH